jgi:hypothetical protein
MFLSDPISQDKERHFAHKYIYVNKKTKHTSQFDFMSNTSNHSLSKKMVPTLNDTWLFQTEKLQLHMMSQALPILKYVNTHTGTQTCINKYESAESSKNHRHWEQLKKTATSERFINTLTPLME